MAYTICKKQSPILVFFHSQNLNDRVWQKADFLEESILLSSVCRSMRLFPAPINIRRYKKSQRSSFTNHSLCRLRTG